MTDPVDRRTLDIDEYEQRLPRNCACGPRHGRTRMPRTRQRYQCWECRSTINWVRAAASRQRY